MFDFSASGNGKLQSNHPIIVITTLPATADTGWLSELIELRLAACITKIPGATSTYRWKDKINTDEELVCLIKSASERLQPLIESIKNHHPYQVPEIAVINISKLNESYWNWLISSTNPSTSK